MPTKLPKPARVSEKKRVQNKSVRTYTRSTLSKARKLLDAKDVEAAKEAVVQTTSALDKAVKKGIIHRNNAARLKSRLTIKLNEVSKDQG